MRGGMRDARGKGFLPCSVNVNVNVTEPGFGFYLAWLGWFSARARHVYVPEGGRPPGGGGGKSVMM